MTDKPTVYPPAVQGLVEKWRKRLIPEWKVLLVPYCLDLIGAPYIETDEISRRMAEHSNDIKVLKPGMSTAPHVFYIGLPDEFVDGVDGQATVRLVADHL